MSSKKKGKKPAPQEKVGGTGLPNLTDISNVVSAYGTTGMIPALPKHDWELENLQDLASMEIPKGEMKANNPRGEDIK
jgi:hypothetical protein